jgi:thiamine biosynthesis protein ThiS
LAIKLTINGEEKSLEARTVADLVAHLGMKADRVAVELNLDIVARDRWAQTELHDGDKLEIVHFVGGGTPRARIA